MSISQFEDVTQNLINLRHVKIIKKKDLILPKWIALQKLYKDGKDSSVVVKSCVSIINSILFQERIYFCITRESLRELLKSDTNWGPSGLGLDNHNYAEIKARLFQSNNIVEVEKGLGRSPGILKLVGADYLKFLNINKDAQLIETQIFNDKLKPKAKKTQPTPKSPIEKPQHSIQLIKADIVTTLQNLRTNLNLNLSEDEISNLEEFELDDTTFEINPKTNKIARYQNGETVNLGALDNIISYFEYNDVNVKYWASLIPDNRFLPDLENWLRERNENN